MSRLVANESGRVIATLGEEVTGLRHARTVLRLDDAPATLYLLARPHRPDGPPLHVAVAGQEVGSLQASTAADILTWHALELPGGIGPGEVPVALSSEGGGMAAWMLGVDHTTGGDAVSTDGGDTWVDRRVGHLHLGPGRYVVRARVAGGDDPLPPRHTWEDPNHPAVRALHDQLPAEALNAEDSWTAVRALSTWVCRSWDYRNTTEAAQYAPWDPLTILDWGARSCGHGGQTPVVMCVHYAIVLAAACQALGIPARCAALTGSINGFDGHFVTEVWSAELGRWVMVDPTFDVTLSGPDGPADLPTIQAMGANISRDAVAAGPGLESRLSAPASQEWFETNLLRGVCFRNRSVWPRSDFLSRPDLSPPGHGATAYSELDLVWERPARDRGIAMFNRYADADWFAEAPQIHEEYQHAD